MAFDGRNIGYITAQDVYIAYSEYYGNGTIYGRCDIFGADGQLVHGPGKTVADLVAMQCTIQAEPQESQPGELVVVPLTAVDAAVVPESAEATAVDAGVVPESAEATVGVAKCCGSDVPLAAEQDREPDIVLKHPRWPFALRISHSTTDIVISFM